MKNEEIILTERLALMDAGIIKNTGKKIIVKDELGSAKEVMEPEEIHTYLGWRERDRQVRKGEKSVDSFRIWKYTVKKPKEGTEEDQSEEERMFMTKAYFFTIGQTDEIKS